MAEKQANTGQPLSGKRVILTGGARGLGEELARALVAEGAHVVIADVLEERGHEVARALREEGACISFFPLDLADPASIEHCVNDAVEFLGGVDCLINNASITNSGGKACDELDIEVWNQVMDVNVRGTWLMTREVVPHMDGNVSSRIVNIASDTVLWGAPNLLAYVASKGAIISMTRSLSRELGPRNITVNAVAPGLVEVEATKYVPESRHRLYRDMRAISRTQQPDDVSGVVTFLLSEKAKFVTGQTLPVNGGFVFN